MSQRSLWQVVEVVNLQDVVAEMPNGLHTLIGEHGGKLSGGNVSELRSRALIRNPEIILLDEATSALDNKSEYRIQQAIRQLLQGKTTFIVAHRLSTIRDADRIVVTKNGTCAEAGMYEELMKKKGFYQLKQMLK